MGAAMQVGDNIRSTILDGTLKWGLWQEPHLTHLSLFRNSITIAAVQVKRPPPSGSPLSGS